MKAFLSALCVVSIAAHLHAAPGQIDAPADPECRLVWNSIAVTASNSIPAGETRRQIALSGQLHLYDITAIAGISHQAVVTHAEDQDGKVIYSSNRPSYPMHFQDHFHHSFGQNHQTPPMGISATFPLTDVPPKSLKHVVGRLDILRPPKMRQLKLALKPHEEPIALSEDMKLRVVEAAQTGQQLRVRMLITASGSSPAPLLAQHYPMPRPGVSIRQLVLVDENGNDSPPINPGSSFRRVNNQIEHSINITVTVPQGTNYELLRFDLAESQVEQIKFELNDVPIPQIAPAQ